MNHIHAIETTSHAHETIRSAFDDLKSFLDTPNHLIAEKLELAANALKWLFGDEQTSVRPTPFDECCVTVDALPVRVRELCLASLLSNWKSDTVEAMTAKVGAPLMQRVMTLPDWAVGS